jgi:hypothetical protein
MLATLMNLSTYVWLPDENLKKQVSNAYKWLESRQGKVRVILTEPTNS